MKISTIFILFCITTGSWGQAVQTENSRFLTYRQNENWLVNLRTLDKSRQWTRIKERFFFKENENISVDSVQFLPMIVINGVPLSIPNKLTDKNRIDLMDLLTDDSIKELIILDKGEGIFCRLDTGVIILTVDEKTYKKVFKLKLE